MKLPHGYTNNTYLVDKTVRKTYSGADAQNRFYTELTIYQKLQDESFMPQLLHYNEETFTIATRYIDTQHGQDLLKEHPIQVPFALGELAKQLQTVQLDAIGKQKRKKGQVLVHGDFGPQNVLFGQTSTSKPYLVDWEWAHFGDEYEDVAWAEWIIRMHYNANQQMLKSLHDGFGMVPPWKIRHSAMLRNCERILDFAKRDGNMAAISIWEARVVQVKSFIEYP